MKFLDDLFVNTAHIPIEGIAIDSRKIKQGFVFIALHGTNLNGLSFVQEAVKNGAVAVLYDAENIPQVNIEVLNFKVKNLSGMLSSVAAEFFDHPSKHIKVVGITGTNGKTSISYFISQALTLLNKKCAVSGTTGFGLLGNLQESNNTTLNALSLQEMLHDFVNQSIEFVAMEVSSHGIHQKRINNVEFKQVIWTNLTHDHLDYHESFEEYGKTKQQFIANNSKRIVNFDDDFIFKCFKDQQVISYSLYNQNSDFFYQELNISKNGSTFTVQTPNGTIKSSTQLIGEFNASNILAVIASLFDFGFSNEHISKILPLLNAPPGRLQLIQQANKPQVIIDYAHTPDALDNILKSVLKHANSKLIVVFGCGGNRDKTKRPQMAKISAAYADLVIITDDNPRYEDNMSILRDIKQGFPENFNFFEIQNRKEAINFAINSAHMSDIVVIAGKGHENYQDINGKKTYFSDVDETLLVLGKYSNV